MIDPVKERQYADCSELIDAWRQYLDMYNMVVTNKGETSPELEQRFLEVKARIAMLHDSFIEAVRHDKNVAQNMLSIVNRSITLKHLIHMGTADQKKIEIEWHETYLLLNETVSVLNEEREELADVNETTFKLKRLAERTLIKFKEITGHVVFKIALAIVIVVAVIIGVPAFGIYDWNELRKVGPISGPVGSVLDFTREKTPIDAPYSNLARFRATHLEGENAPAGYSVESDGEQKSNLVGTMRFFEVRNQPASDLLDKAEEYSGHSIRADGGGPAIRAYLFYFFTSADARAFSLAHNRAVTGETGPPDREQWHRQRRTYVDNNVMILLAAPSMNDMNQLENVAREVFGQIP